MNQYLENLDRMLGAWNTSKDSEVRDLAELALEHNVHFVDPNHNIMGREAFIEMVLAVKKQIPGAIYSRASRIDIQNNHCRYHWEIHMNEDLDLAPSNQPKVALNSAAFEGARSECPQRGIASRSSEMMN